jgi:hypothetical protein
LLDGQNGRSAMANARGNGEIAHSFAKNLKARPVSRIREP